MRKQLQLLILLVLVCTSFSRILQTTYDYIIIGSGAAGIGACATLASKSSNFIILQARNRTGGRTHATTISNVNVDLGASFVHNPQSNNAVNTYVKNLNWPTTPANFSAAEVLYQTGQPTSDSSITKTIRENFVTFATNKVKNGTDISLQDCWNSYNASVGGGYSATNLNRAFFDVYLEANLNGADLNTVSTIAYVSTSGKSTNDYLPGTSYAALITAIYSAYCKNVQIILNTVVTNIDYSGSVVKITAANGMVYYAKKVINTIPLGVLKSGAVTFTPSLPANYQTAIDNIGMGVFNKIIVTLSNSFWPGSSTKVVDLVFNTPTNISNFPQFYVASTNPNVLLFFISGNGSTTLNTKSNDQIKASLLTAINAYGNTGTISDIVITKWQQDPYSKGSYSYYKVGTTSSSFNTLMTGIDNKLWFAGEHTHPNQSSNVHGAFQTGMWAAQSASGIWQLINLLSLLALVLVA